MFTLIGGGIRSFEDSKKPMKYTLPKNAKWFQDNVMSFEPTQNQVTMSNGDIVQYEIMIVAMGLQLYWEKVRLDKLFYIKTNKNAFFILYICIDTRFSRKS